MLDRGSYYILVFNSFNKFSIEITLIQYLLFIALHNGMTLKRDIQLRVIVSLYSKRLIKMRSGMTLF
jgi:hypothetical protein